MPVFHALPNKLVACNGNVQSLFADWRCLKDTKSTYYGIERK
jgi:hypothetical protein